MQAQQAQLAAQQEALAQQQAGSTAGARCAGNSLDDQPVQIQKLPVMKDQGLLTDEEFQAKKRQIPGHLTLGTGLEQPALILGSAAEGSFVRKIGHHIWVGCRRLMRKQNIGTAA